MKRTLFSALLSLIFIPMAFSQDFITTKKGEEINVKVLEITQSDIKYSTADKAGVLQSLPLEQVFMVKYENGTKDIFTEQAAALNEAPALNQAPVAQPTFNAAPARPVARTNNYGSDNLFIQGQTDAEVYYRGYKTAGTVTLITTLLFPPVGLVTAIGTSSSKPTRDNLDFPDSNLFADQEYARGYTSKAKKTKSGKVWKNFGIGMGSLLVLSILANAGGQ